ncbi:MAG: glucose-6-phosphate dehydrogenase [Planctomycetota bacterium]|nr:glucose-6-phosphate dehydrogenase [Planctomycetota bacterium]
MTTSRPAPPLACDQPLAIIVVGASGNLARKKIFPALFSLFCQDYLPPRFWIYGFARSPFTPEKFRQHIAENLTCRYTPPAACAERQTAFLARCYYCAGDYAQSESFLDLFDLIRATAGEKALNCVWYLAIPPALFLATSRAIGNAGLIHCAPDKPWSRVVIEKPFGRDRESSDALASQLAEVFREEQIYRIDHYLGKEVIQNLLVLRFGNLIFQPIWSRRFIQSVTISWREDLTIEGRGGYFDSYGIIRDVMQNHLLQIVALLAMEPPTSLAAERIRDAKVKALRAVLPVARQDIAIGQYGSGICQGKVIPAYVDDPSVPRGSRAATYAAAVLRIDNPRWRGIPFFLEAGKGLDCRRTEIRIRFRETPKNFFSQPGGESANELIIVVQPEEAIRLRLLSKVPGLQFAVDNRTLDLIYNTAFADRKIPDAYECLLLDIIASGDRSLFIRSDELAAAWDIFTPILHWLDREEISPEIYPFGSAGPRAAQLLAQRYGVVRR